MPVTLQWFGDKAKKLVEARAASRLTYAGVKCVEEARRMAPHRTGNLRDSIGFTFNSKTMTLKIHADAPYAIFVEFGTMYMAARPYMRPAIAKMGTWLMRGVGTEMQFLPSAMGATGRTSAGRHLHANIAVNKAYAKMLKKTKLHQTRSTKGKHYHYAYTGQPNT